MNEVLKIILSLSVSGSLLALVLFVLKPVYKNHLRKSWQYYIWIIVLLRMILPFTPEANLIGLFTSSIEQPLTISETYTPYISPKPHPNTLPDDISTPEASNAADILAIIHDTDPVTPTVDFSIVLPYLWLLLPLIAFILILRKSIQYHKYTNQIQANCRKVENQSEYDINELYEKTRQEIGIKRNIPLYINPFVNTPMLVGVFKPYLILPEVDFSENECRMILRHELIHYKRRDILYKWFAQLVVYLHWFNPLVYLVCKEINKNCELSCDEAVISYLSEAEKLNYGDALMAAIRKTSTENTKTISLITVNMSEDGRYLKERLKSIMKYSKKTIVASVLSCFLALTLIAGAFYLGAYTNRNVVTEAMGLALSGEEVLESFEDEDSLENPNLYFDQQINEFPVNFDEFDWSQAWDGFDELILSNFIDISKLANIDEQRKHYETQLIDLTEELKDIYKSFNPNSKNWQNINGKIYSDLNELHALVFNEERITELEFTDITHLFIEGITTDAIIRQGGDKLLIRYGEWLENEYQLSINNGRVTLKASDMPYYSPGPSFLSNSWFNDYLKSIGVHPRTPIEIIIPEGMSLSDCTIKVIVGDVKAERINIDGNFKIESVNGNLSIKNSNISGRLAAETINGNINITDSESGDSMKALTINGNAHISNSKSGGNMEAVTFQGRSRISNSESAGSMKAGNIT